MTACQQSSVGVFQPLGFPLGDGIAAGGVSATAYKGQLRGPERTLDRYNCWLTSTGTGAWNILHQIPELTNFDMKGEQSWDNYLEIAEIIILVDNQCTVAHIRKGFRDQSVIFRAVAGDGVLFKGDFYPHLAGQFCY